MLATQLEVLWSSTRRQQTQNGRNIWKRKSVTLEKKLHCISSWNAQRQSTTSHSRSQVQRRLSWSTAQLRKYGRRSTKSQISLLTRNQVQISLKTKSTDRRSWQHSTSLQSHPHGILRRGSFQISSPKRNPSANSSQRRSIVEVMANSGRHSLSPKQNDSSPKRTHKIMINNIRLTQKLHNNNPNSRILINFYYNWCSNHIFSA